MTSPVVEPEPVRPIPPALVWVVGMTWRVALLALLAGVSIVGLYRLRVVVVPIVVALMIASVLSPPARFLERHHVPPLAATWLVFFVAFAAFAGVGAWAGPRVVNQFHDLGPALSASLDRVTGWLTDGPFHFSHSQIDRWANDAKDALSANRDQLVHGLFRGARLVVDLATGALLSVVLAFFFVKDGPRISGWVAGQLDGNARRDLREVGGRAWKTLAGYIRGSSIDGVIEASLKAIGLLVLGVPLVVPLALLTFFGGYLPFVGAVLAGVVSASVALVAKGPGTALMVALLSLAIQTVEKHLLQPLVMRRAIELHPTVILVSITTGGALAGILGAFIAVPFVAVTVSIGDYFLHERRTEQSQLVPPEAAANDEVVAAHP